MSFGSHLQNLITMVTTMGLVTGEIGDTTITTVVLDGIEGVKGLWSMRSGYQVIGLGYPMGMSITSEGT